MKDIYQKLIAKCDKCENQESIFSFVCYNCEKKMQWIDINHEKPKEDEKVMVFMKLDYSTHSDDKINIASLRSYNNGFYIFKDSTNCPITINGWYVSHWMTLPGSPNE